MVKLSRNNHEKAVTYFQRALKLNPNYLAAWTLMGHEFIELKNNNAAVQCYRHAVGESVTEHFRSINLKGLRLIMIESKCPFSHGRSQQERLSRLVRPRSDLRNVEDALLRSVLLQKDPRTEAEWLEDVGGPWTDVRKAGQDRRRDEVLLEGSLRW